MRVGLFVSETWGEGSDVGEIRDRALELARVLRLLVADPGAEQPTAQAFNAVLQAARWPNVALKWAHAPAYFDAGGYPNAAARPFLRKALDAFGAERVMWASDHTTNQTGETWAELLFAVLANPELGEDERDRRLGGTAREWLDWPEQAG